MNGALKRIEPRRWEGLHPAIVGGRFHTKARCEDCGTERVWTTRTVHEPGIAVTRAHKAGWETGKRLVCPECQQKRRKPKEEVKVVETVNAPMVAEATPSDAAKKAKRLVYMALEDYYDDGKKAYKPGWTDDRIAKEVGCAEAFVARIREDDFGPVGVPPELEAFRKEVEAAAAVEEEARVRAEIAAKLAGDAKEGVRALEARLNAMAVKNGWRV